MPHPARSVSLLSACLVALLLAFEFVDAHIRGTAAFGAVPR